MSREFYAGGRCRNRAALRGLGAPTQDWPGAGGAGLSPGVLSESGVLNAELVISKLIQTGWF